MFKSESLSSNDMSAGNRYVGIRIMGQPTGPNVPIRGDGCVFDTYVTANGLEVYGLIEKTNWSDEEMLENIHAYLQDLANKLNMNVVNKAALDGGYNLRILAEKGYEVGGNYWHYTFKPEEEE